MLLQGTVSCEPPELGWNGISLLLLLRTQRGIFLSRYHGLYTILLIPLELVVHWVPFQIVELSLGSFPIGSPSEEKYSSLTVKYDADLPQHLRTQALRPSFQRPTGRRKSSRSH